MKTFLKFLFFTALVIAVILLIMLNMMGRPGDAQKKGLEQSVTTLTGWHAHLGVLKDFALAPSIILQAEDVTLAPRIGVPDKDLVTIRATDIRIPWSSYLARSGWFERLKFENVRIPEKYSGKPVVINSADHKVGVGYVTEGKISNDNFVIILPAAEKENAFMLDWDKPLHVNFAEGTLEGDVGVRLVTPETTLFIFDNIKGNRDAMPLTKLDKAAECILLIKTWAEDKPDFILSAGSAFMGDVWPWQINITSQTKLEVLAAQEAVIKLQDLSVLPEKCLPQ